MLSPKHINPPFFTSAIEKDGKGGVEEMHLFFSCLVIACAIFLHSSGFYVGGKSLHVCKRINLTMIINVPPHKSIIFYYKKLFYRRPHLRDLGGG